MPWLNRKSRTHAEISAAGPASLRVKVDEAVSFIDLTTASWIAFVNVGDSFLANEGGWWVIGTSDGAHALSVECPSVDMIMRQNPLADAADRAPELQRIDYAEVPRRLRSSGTGVVHLNRAEADALRSGGSAMEVSSVRDFPTIP